MKRTSSLCSVGFAALAAAILLAGCVATPAPIVNHSFGPPQPTATTSSGPTEPVASSSGVQTFGTGAHANGTTTAAGYTVAPGDTLYSVAFAHGLDFKQLAADNGIPPPYVIHPGQVLKLSAGASAPVASGGRIAATSPPVAAPQPASPPNAQPGEPVFGPVTTTAAPVSSAASAEPPASTAVVTVPPAAAPAAAPVANSPSPVPTPATAPAVAATPAPPPGAARDVAGITWSWPAPGALISGFQAGSGGDGAGIDIAGKAGDPVLAAAAGTVVYSGDGLPGYGALIIIKHNDTYLSAYGHNSKRLVKEGQHVAAGQEIALMGASGAPRVELHFEIRKNGKPVDPMAFLPKR